MVYKFIIIVNMRILLNISRVLLFVILFGFLNGCDSKSERLTAKSAMQEFKESTPLKGAIFYKNNREQYKFLDKLYGDSIVPALEYCTYYELKEVNGVLSNTPYSNKIRQLMDRERKLLLSNIYEEISSHMREEQEVFINEILPSLELGIDSIANHNVEEITEEYSGGFMNYKKLYFFFGRDEEDFEKIWKDKVNADIYHNYIISNSKYYFDLLCEMKSLYFKEITGRNLSKKITFELTDSELSFNDSIRNVVKNFTDKEKTEMTIMAVKDYVIPTALGAFSFGTGALIYECANMAYDVKTVYDDIQKGEMGADELLKIQCESYVNEQIMNNYLNEYKNKVLNEIFRINNDLYSLIVQVL